MQASRTSRYRPSLVALHWLTLLLLIGVYACIELRGMYPRGSAARALIKDWHYALGLAVFALTWLRLALRATGTTPPILPQPPAWQAGLAHLVAFLLYAMLLALPVLGYLSLNADGHAVVLLGIEFPRLIAENPALAHNLEEIHETIGTAGYFLIGLHASAALLHHYVRRDNALRRMSLRG
ncbi:cytochrome B [Pseudoxanthomonas sangjuensis]|uniref:cytochrome b n=1 Tax=Pseudoxanthomonas sangjuensis TaxID=1503750 RepID=UPI001391E6B7|nr:cytochrome b [Pseudoxanthomonas sangjuensis]KAF1713557.1 cytochrome B [Pseudoxanthomonas sangjuensis]